MIGDISRWLEARLKADQYQERGGKDDLRIATAALLVEAARADHHFTDVERERLVALLRQQYALSAHDADDLLAHARQHSAKAVSLTDLTQVVKRHTSAEERKSVLVSMWKVALADGRIDKYEEYVIRQVAGLLYIPHHDYIHARQLAIEGN